ncbi:MAG: Cyanophycin synthetase [Microgenomates bacterium OLB23]|nr:MAG: Cyanophycin synthetase [Microgenomates bacterium OLB23]
MNILWSFTKTGIWKINRDHTKAPTERSLVIWEEALRRGIEMEGLIIYGKYVEHHRAKINNKWHHFESLPIPSRFAEDAYEWMDDKWELKKFLLAHRIPTAYGASVTNLEDALKIFNKGRKPFITKPQIGSRGRHTTTHIYTKEELIHGFRVAKKLCRYVIVEEHLVGSVYRGTYINGEVVGILRGDPPRITGDGTSTIKQLISIKNKNRHPEVAKVRITDHLKEFIKRQGLSLATVLKKSQTIDLSEKIGTSYGGYRAEEITITHPKIIKYVKKAGDRMRVPIVGFDFIIEDITKDPDTQKWGFIEANSLPFIDLHHFPLEGEAVNAAAKVWDLWDN